MAELRARCPRSVRQAKQMLIYGCLLPVMNAASALALGLLVVYSDADAHKVLTGVLSAANVGGWLCWLIGSLKTARAALERWSSAPAQPLQIPHPGFRLILLLSVCGAMGWVGVLGLLAYGMLG
jgi:hypothetical protein